MRCSFILGVAAMLAAPVPLAARTPEQTAEAALRAAPVWDGHNDVPWQLRERTGNMIAGFDFHDTTRTADPVKGLAAMHTDLARLRTGRVGAQFWSVWVPASFTDAQAVQATVEQIDVTRRLIARYPGQLAFASSAADVERAMRAGQIASLIGMEGGHSIGGSLAVLRQMFALGARYMTLTHSRTTAWADSATDDPRHDGLSPFGRQAVREMQRIGMLVDLSHVSEAAMLDALEEARAPVIFSHSGARPAASHPRNVPDTVLDRVKANGGIVMVVSLPDYVSDTVREWSGRRAGEKARIEALRIGDPTTAVRDLAAWLAANPPPRSTIAQLADHIDHIAHRIGVAHVGLGADFDGMSSTTEGLDDVAGYPALFAELARRGYSQPDLEKIASRNMLRVMRAAEAFAARHRGDPPLETPTAF